MKFLFIVILFVVAVAVFTLLAGLGYRTSVESELRQISMSELKAAGFDGVDVGFDHLHASVSGEVDSEEDKARVIELLSSKVLTAHFPSLADVALEIRPTVHPEVHISRSAGGNVVFVSGTFASTDKAALVLIAGRLNSLEAIETINNSIALDPRRFTFPGAAELASLASQLIEKSDEVDVHMIGNVLTIEGEVENDGLKAALIDLGGRVGVGELIDRLNVAEPVSLRVPSTLKMTRNRFGVTLSGTVGSEESKDAIFGILSRMDAQLHLTDKLDVSRSYSPAVWEECAPGIFPTLLEKFSGELTADLTAETVRLSGKVADEAARDDVIAVFRELKARQPSLKLLTEIEILSAPVEAATSIHFLATFEGELLILDGILPGVAFVDVLEARLSSRFPDLGVKNDLTEGDGDAKAPWLDNLPEFFEELISRTENSNLEYEGKTLVLGGNVKVLIDKQILQNIATNSFPEGTVIQNELISAEDQFPQLALMPQVRTQIAESLKALPVYFDSGSEIVKESQSEKMDSVIEIITKTGVSPPLLVTGFADNVGNAEYNRALSLRRANEVIQRLEIGGIPKESISVEIKGEDVSNVTRSDRWKSRRVEVSLVPLETAAEEGKEAE